MAARPKRLIPVRRSQITTFKIRNRSSYAAIFRNNLTEGRTIAQAIARLKHPLRRMGYALPE